MIIKECGNCEFYTEFDEELGICYRYPPVYIGGDSMLEASWDKPTVNENSSCGEFKAAVQRNN